ncbi:MAG: hypothetical protein ACHP6I_02330, partial [Rickettsiales bacterium]
MRENILQHFEIATPETSLAAELILGICRSKHVSSNALSTYVSGDAKASSKERRIERFFKMMKTSGLNLESTKMTKAKQLEKLVLVCSIAYLLCVKIGVFCHKNIKALRWKKKDRCYEYSFFRYGLD